MLCNGDYRYIDNIVKCFDDLKYILMYNYIDLNDIRKKMEYTKNHLNIKFKL